ncbi:MAG: DUF5053 domain-containing protein [Tannerellaceae bacterium]|jgi:hypothetical protein|nr:DUF5053 domain-containing protein [Tannerellaceae bacterium]
MDARKEIEKLKREFVSLKTEEERKVFDVKLRNNLQSKTEEEKQEFAKAFVNSAHSDAKRIKEFCNEATIRLKLQEILGVVSMAYIAREYFHKSKYWFSQKLNGNLKNGMICSFTEDEMKTLVFALKDINAKIQNALNLIV